MAFDALFSGIDADPKFKLESNYSQITDDAQRAPNVCLKGQFFDM